MAAFLVAGMSCTLAACDDDDAGTPPPTEPGVEAVIGTYSGTMSLEEAAPTAGNETSETTELEASVSVKEVLFADFPIRELVVRIAGEDGADAIVEAIGKVSYTATYTAQMSEDKASVSLTLAPEPLKLTMPVEGEEPSSLEIEVGITAARNGSYTLESSKLDFSLAVESISVGGTPLEGFEAFTLHFDLTKSK